MTWKKQLQVLEDNKEWDFAIQLMQQVIKENPNDLDAYLSINYLLMNLLVEEDYDESKEDYYIKLTKKYFDESYAKFSHNPEYLYYTAKTAYMSQWFFGIEDDELPKTMLYDALRLEPNNILYRETYYTYLDWDNPFNKKEIYDYAKIVLQKNSPIQQLLLKKGSLGKYLLGLMIYWSNDIIREVEKEKI